MKTSIVGVLGGGASAEREVSLRSAAAVTAALQTAGFGVQQFDPSKYRDASLLDALQGCDVVFPVLHGMGGEDGTIQALLESKSIAYVGADAAVSAVCFNKLRYKESIRDLAIATPNNALVNKDTLWQSPLTARPYVLKPYDGGSSVDTFIVRDPANVDRAAIDEALERYGEMLLEELIEGQEITVGVLADAALPVIEIIPPRDGEFDYENKYNGKSQELCPPQHIDTSLQQQAQEIAGRIHRALRVRDMSRTDMIIRQSDATIYVLETNTIPGMTEQSLLPKAAAAAGYSMPEMCRMLVEAAAARRATA